MKSTITELTLTDDKGNTLIISYSEECAIFSINSNGFMFEQGEEGELLTAIKKIVDGVDD